jgi:PKD repeat protein
MWPTDSLEIYNGSSNTAPKLITLGAGPTGQVPLTASQSIIRGGRSLHFRYKPGSGALPANYDSATFSIRWVAKPATFPKPTSAFDMPDTVYSNQLVSYAAKSTGTLMSYSWDTDGNGVYDSTTTNPTRTFLITIPTLRKICLATRNCVGSDTLCKNIAFLPVNRATVARFGVDKTIGFNTDTFKFKDQSINGVLNWRWSFTPNIVQYLNGTSSTSQNPQVRLTSAVKYTVKLVAGNAFGTDSITKIDFVDVNAYQTPGVGTTFAAVADATMGLRRIRLDGIDRNLPPGTDNAIFKTGIDSIFQDATGPSYQYINNTTQVANLYRGGKYIVVLNRPSAGVELDYKVWIDYNFNAEFEANELVLNKINNGDAQVLDTINIAANQAYGSTRMRVGLDIAKSSQFNQVYSVIGIFKDYNITISPDVVKPSIALNGSNILRTEINKNFNDPGVTIIDNVEGNISSRVQTISTLNTNKIGVYSIRYYGTDYSGNTTDTLARNVIVELNTTGPAIALKGADTIRTDVKNPFVDPGVVALDNNGNDISNNVVIITTLNTNVVGNYQVRYSVTDAFNFTKFVDRVVIVQDTIKPVLANKFTGTEYKHQVGSVFNPLNIVSATDNYDKSLSVTFASGVNPNIIGRYFVTYFVTDAAGNRANEFRVTVDVSDYIKPQIALVGSETTEVEVLTNFEIPGVVATDNFCDNSTLIIVRTPANLRNDTLGIFPVKFVVTDCVGNKDSVIRFIKISKRTLPVISLLGENPMNLNRFCDYNEPGFNIIDNYYTNLKPQVIINKEGLRNDVPGLYPITYVVTDPSGNRSKTVTRSINVLEQVCNTGVYKTDFEAEFKLYPSPSKGILNIDISNQASIEKIEIFDATGKKVAQFNEGFSAKNTFDIANQSNGIYFVKIYSNKGNFSKSLVINK